MLATIALSLLLAMPPDPGAELELRSADGRFVARIADVDGGARTAALFGAEQLRAEGAAAQPLWSAPYPAASEDERHVLVAQSDRDEPDSDELALLAHVRPFLGGEGEEPVTLHGRGPGGEGARLRAWTAGELHLAPEDLLELPAGRRWLARTPEAARAVSTPQPWGAELELALDFEDGRRVALDLWSGDVHALDGSEAPVEPMSWEPRAEAPAESQLPYVRDLERFELVPAGAPIELVMHGAFPTSGWKLEGIALHGARLGPKQRFGAERAEIQLALEPVSTPPPADAPQRAVLKPFQQRITLRDLPPGDYVLRVLSRDDRERGPWPFTVLDPTLTVWLRVSGGIAGIDRTTSVFSDGWVERGGTRPLPPSPAHFRSSEEQRTAVAEGVARLPKRSFTSLSTVGADLMCYDLVWLDGGIPMRARVDDTTAEGALGELILLLSGLGSS